MAVRTKMGRSGTCPTGYRISGQVGAVRDRVAAAEMRCFWSSVRESETTLLELAGSRRRVVGKSVARKWRSERKDCEMETAGVRAWITASSRAKEGKRSERRRLQILRARISLRRPLERT